MRKRHESFMTNWRSLFGDIRQASAKMSLAYGNIHAGLNRRNPELTFDISKITVELPF